VPYLLEVQKEVGIYKKNFLQRAQDEGITVAPHSLDVAALWAVLTRLDPEITASEAIRDGRGMYGVSPRFLQNVFDDVLVHSRSVDNNSVSPFTVVRVIKEHLNKDDFQDRKNWAKYHALLQGAVNWLTQQVRNDVFGTFVNDTDQQRAYFGKYLKNLQLWKANPESADEQFLTRVEKKMKAPVPNAAVREYRDNLLVKLDALDSMPVTLDMLDEDPNLKTALAEIMFEDMKNQLDGAPADRLIENLKKLGPADSPIRYTEATAKEALEHLTTPHGIV
jgi:serine protein kinase